MSPAKETKQITEPTGDTDKLDQKSTPDDGEVTVNQPLPQPEPQRISPDRD
jgi:hypothetical protein